MADFPFPSNWSDAASFAMGAQKFEDDRIAQSAAAAELLMMSQIVGEEVTRTIDARIAELKGCTIIFRTTWGKMRQVRKGERSGDLGVVVTFGPQPYQNGVPQEIKDELQSQVQSAGLTCGAAAVTFIALAVGTFFAGPVGWVLLAFTFIDSVVVSTAAISCMWSGIRVLNSHSGNREANTGLRERTERIDQGFDAIGLTALPRNAAGLGLAARDIYREVKITKEFSNEVVISIGAGLGTAASRHGGLLAKMLHPEAALRDDAGRAVSDVVAPTENGIRGPDFTVALISS